MRVFSGIQPTGAKHIGNYIGAMRQYVATQDEGDAFFCIVDLHSITVDYDPRDLHDRTLDLAALLFAVGLDPDRCTLFCQSHVTAHAEAAWLLSAVTGFGQLGRMTAFKEKGEGKDFVSAGLFTYPVLMAGDILLYQTDIVPIGDDQRQHLELSRDVAERFNSRYGETFKVPRGVYPEVGARIMDLQEPTKKMSTTGGTPQGTVLVLDDAGHDPQEVQDGGHRLGTRDPLRARREARRLEPDRDPLGRERARDPRRRGRLRRQGLRRPEDGRRRGGRRALQAGAGAVCGVAQRRGRASSTAPNRRGQGADNVGPDSSTRCTNAWVSSTR